MNRTDLVDFVAERAELTKATATRAFDALLEAITQSLQKGDPVIITNFGTFTVKTRAAREGHNPATGGKIKIAATRVVGFKAGKALKEAVKDQEPIDA
jgi:DNA-binding protein HU-beta